MFTLLPILEQKHCSQFRMQDVLREMCYFLRYWSLDSAFPQSTTS